MITQTKGKIFLTTERGYNELNWYRSYNTFKFGNYQNEHKDAVGALYVLNDDTLAPGGSIRMSIEEDSQVVLLPLAGALTFKDSLDNTDTLHPGEAQLLHIPKDEAIRISNPAEHDLVNFLQVWFKRPANVKANQSTIFNLVDNKNKLISLFDGLHFSIGQFDGRAETEYHLHTPGAALFTFVIDGEFEAQHRLLHARDGLALWDIQSAEMEALSNEAIVVVMEV